MSAPDPLLDFRNFLFLVWKHLRLPEPTPIQYDIADYLQRGPKRLIVQGYRGVGKSWITVAFVLWNLYCDPQKKVLVVSASGALARDFTTFCLQLLRSMPELAHLRPGPDQRESSIAFDVRPARAAKDPSVASIGINGQMTGHRADLFVLDDIEVANNSLTQVMRDKLSEQVKEIDAIITPERGRVVYLGTPQTEQTIYNLLLKRGYLTRIWPARYPTQERLEFYQDKLAPFLWDQLSNNPKLTWQPTDPGRFGELDLLEREASYGRSGFALQFMLDSSFSDADRYPLKCRDFLVFDIDPERAPEKPIWGSGRDQIINDLPCVGFEGDHWYRPITLEGSWIPYTGSVLAIDPAGRGKDELAYCVLKLLNGYLYIHAWGGLQGGPTEENLRYLAGLAKTHKVAEVVVETNFGDGMFGQLLKPILQKVHPHCKVEEVRHHKAKEHRICDTIEPPLNNHRLVLSPKIIQDDFKSTENRPGETKHYYQGLFQLTRICREKGALVRDDRIDALAIAVAYFSEQMDLDSDQAMGRRKDDLFRQEFEEWEAHSLGFSSPKADRWI